jgi:hypothetical protein
MVANRTLLPPKSRHPAGLRSEQRPRYPDRRVIDGSTCAARQVGTQQAVLARRAVECQIGNKMKIITIVERENFTLSAMWNRRDRA